MNNKIKQKTNKSLDQPGNIQSNPPQQQDFTYSIQKAIHHNSKISHIQLEDSILFRSKICRISTNLVFLRFFMLSPYLMSIVYKITFWCLCRTLILYKQDNQPHIYNFFTIFLFLFFTILFTDFPLQSTCLLSFVIA